MKKLLVVLLSLMTVLTVFFAPISITAENTVSQQDNTTLVNVHFFSSGREWDYKFPYSDEWFKQPDNQYNHQLCRGSFGLTTAAFRRMNLKLGFQDISLLQYYKDTGFTNIETYNYENAPSDDSISNGIASKVIDDFTLLAVGVCGSGYKDEWCSNLTMGELIRHEGFQSAAIQVEKRIEDYIHKYNITGKIKVWLTGFSRASAVSNLVAADLTDSGKYAGVFGYHFAVPNNTTEEKKYDNLFCIVGKNDPVPFVALKEWGYGKFGTVLYTPSKEADSRFNVKLMKASMVYEELTGEPLKVSPALNKSIRLILSNLLDMVPDRNNYVSILQQSVITAWHAKGNTSDLIAFITSVLSELGNANSTIQEKTSSLGEYLLNLGVEFTTRNPDSVFASDLYENFNLPANLVREHQPMVYIAWLFSNDNPDEIFSSSLDFTRLFIYGNVTINIFDDEGLIETIEDGMIKRHSQGSKLSSNNNFLYSKQEGNRIELVVPKDQNYLIQVQCDSNKFTYEGVTFTGRELNGHIITRTLVDMKDKNSYYILSRKSGDYKGSFIVEEGSELIESAYYASPTVLLAMENSNVFHLTFAQMKDFGILNVAILAALVILILVRITRVRFRKKKASRLVTFGINLSISFIFMLLYEQGNIYLDSVPIVRTVLGILTLMSVMHLSYTAMKPINRRLSKFFLVGILFIAFGNASKAYISIDFSTIVYTVACAIITIGIVTEKRPSKKLAIIWIVASIVLSALVCYLLKDIHLCLVVYIFAITAMNISAEHMDRRLRFLIGAFILPSCLSVWESYSGGNVKIHTFLVLAYSTGLLLLIAVILYQSYRLEKKYEKKVVTQ